LLNRKALLGALLIFAAILYLSLYPFRLKHAVPPIGPIGELLLTARRGMSDEGDFIANILLYLPLGFFAVRALAPGLPSALRLIIATLAGAALSTAMEISEFYIARRYCDAWDVYANTAGTAMGALVGVTLGAKLRLPWLAALERAPVPTLLIAAYSAARLYPYVPELDWRKYRWAIRPLLEASLGGPGEFFFRSACWLILCHLFERLFGFRDAVKAFVCFAALSFAGRIIIIGLQVSANDVVSAGLAFLVWISLLRVLPARSAWLALLAAAAIIDERLAPFRFSAAAHRFDWMPFLSLLRSANDVALVATFTKLFLYGALTWLLTEAGMRPWRAVVFVPALLLGCGILDMYLPGRTAGLTDASLALLIGLFFQLIVPARARAQPA
jgi:VanZ family protein